MLKNRRLYIIPVVGFLVLIVFVAALFLFPVSHRVEIDLFDAIFLAAGAVTGTGFSTFSISENLTLFGQIVLLLAVQIGTLGFMIFFAFLLSARHKKIKLSDTLILSNEINFNNHTKVKERTYQIIKYTFFIEFIGAMLLSIGFIPKYGIIKGMWYGLFHSISSFCNAGFDLIGSNSLVTYTHDLYFNIIIISLMLLGGLGYFVLEDITNCIKNRTKHLQVHSKIILTTSSLVIVISTLLLKLLSPNLTIIQALFNTVTARSTGFYTIDFSLLNDSSKLLMIILMFIGGAAGSCAGGIRLVNLAIIVLFPLSVLKGKEIIVFYRKIDTSIIRKSYTMVSVYLFLIIIGWFSFLLTNNQISALDSLFEIVSSFSSAGMGTFDVNNLNEIGKIILMIYMYIGKLAPIVFLTLFSFNTKNDDNITFPNADLML